MTNTKCSVECGVRSVTCKVGVQGVGCQVQSVEVQCTA